jgi:hypothetical protein
MAEKNLVTNPDAVKPINASEIKPVNKNATESGDDNAIEERYLFDLFQNLEKAEESQDEAAQLKAFQALQNYYISQETMGDKAAVVGSSINKGINKGISVGIGLPVDIVNLILGVGEKGLRNIMNEIGFEVSPDNKIISDEPFLGGEQIKKLFNAVGAKTDYDKTRLLSQVTGRIAEEVGINLPLMGLPLKGATPKNMLKIGGFELSAATAAGSGGAWGQVIDQNTNLKYPGTNVPVNLEAWGMALGYVSPITVSATFKALSNKLGLKNAYDQIFRPHSAATKAAANILFSRMDEGQINKLMTDLQRKDMTAEEIQKKFGLEQDEMSILFGDSINQTNFPRSLDEILGSEDLARLKEQIMNDPNGLELAQAIDAYKYTRMLHMENTLRGKLMSEDYMTTGKQGDVIPGNVSLSIENRIAGINNYMSSRLALAEQIAAEKMKLVGPNLSRADATKILKMELEEGLSDMLRQEKLLWGKVGDNVNATNIGDGAMEIMFSQFKTTPSGSVPPLLKKLVGEERLVEAGMLKLKKGKKPKPGLLDGSQSIGEILNLKSLIHDEIRKASKQGTKEGDLLAQNYQSLLNDVDNSLLGGVSEANIEKANSALTFSNKIQTDIYDSSVGNLLEYSTTKGNPQIIDAKKFEELMQKGEAGGIQSSDFLNILNGESAGLQAKIKDDIARLVDPRTGLLPAKTLERYIQQNEELINQFPELKSQLLDADAAKILVEDRLALQARTEKDLANYRSNTILSSSDLGLSNNTIIKNVFSSGNVEDKLQAMDNIVTLLNRSDDSGLALQGFQDSVTEYIFNTIKPTTKGGKKVLSLKSTTDFINDNMDLLTKVYGEESAQMWKEFGDTLVAIEPALLKGNVGALDVFSKQNIFISSLGRILGAKAGSLGAGPPLVLAGLGGRAANAMLSGKTQAETIRILSRALRDPEFAALLIKPLSDEVDAQILEQLNRFIKDDNAVLTTTTRIGTESFKESGERLTEDNEEPQASLPAPVNPESRLANTNMANPIGAGDMAAMSTNPGPVNMDTMAKGSQLFSGPNEITFAAQGGIMNARKPIQRVA